MIAFVRSVTAAPISSGSMFRSPSRTSTKTGRRARMDDHVRRRRPGDRSRDHLVSLADPERDEREVHRRGAGRDREHVLRVEVLGHPLLEQRRTRARRQPAGAERVRDGLDLLLADRGWLEAELRLASSFDDEAYFVCGGASTGECVVAAVADRDHRSGAVRRPAAAARSGTPARGRSARRALPRRRAPPPAPRRRAAPLRARRETARTRPRGDFVFLKHKPRFRARSRARGRSASAPVAASASSASWPPPRRAASSTTRDPSSPTRIWV